MIRELTACVTLVAAVGLAGCGAPAKAPMTESDFRRCDTATVLSGFSSVMITFFRSWFPTVRDHLCVIAVRYRTDRECVFRCARQA